MLFTRPLAGVVLSQRIAQRAVSVLFSSVFNSTHMGGGINADLVCKGWKGTRTTHICTTDWSLEASQLYGGFNNGVQMPKKL